uniref:2-Cys peroxiredoxin n=1 Tax=Thalassionema nitzschioides TaxID=33649 RepID=UPI001EDE4E99|nr:2-Cys peroxiredoxin [Thalassionema nitzschioides]UHY40732.1 2-Cys peroxiredoxin [Thalassionema nitzschioides]
MSDSLQVGKLAPNFLSIGVYKNKLGKIRLSDYRGKKYIILVFYPANFTPVSISELIRLNDYVLEFKKFSTQILAVSIDSPFSHLQFLLTKRYKNSLEELDLDFPLISDVTQKITKEYQLLTDDGLACPALFIIDKEGIIQYYTINNLLCARSVDEIIRVLHSIQYVKENPGQICPII